MIVVAFHTPEYADCAAPFRAAVEALGLRCEIAPFPSSGNWERNTGLKPLALGNLRATLRGPLLYLDIDAQLLRVPALPAGEWDLAVCENPVKKHVNRVNAAAFFVADTPGAIEFLDLWRAFVRASITGRDHPQLTRTIAKHRGTIAMADVELAGCYKLNGFRPQRTQVKQEVAVG